MPTVNTPWTNPTVQLWSRRRSRSQELKQLHEGDWQLYWRWYRNYTEPLVDPADWWRSNETIPTVFKVIETLLPRYVLGMFESPDWFTVEARQKKDEQYEQLCSGLLRTTVEEMHLFPKMVDAMRYSQIMGHCWGKVVWREEYTRRQVLVPFEEMVDPFAATSPLPPPGGMLPPPPDGGMMPQMGGPPMPPPMGAGLPPGAPPVEGMPPPPAGGASGFDPFGNMQQLPQVTGDGIPVGGGLMGGGIGPGQQLPPQMMDPLGPGGGGMGMDGMDPMMGMNPAALPPPPEIRQGVEVQVIEDEVYNNVDFEWRPLDRIFPDPTGEGRWYIEEIDTTLEQLEETQDSLGIYDKSEFARLKSSISQANARDFAGGDALTDSRLGTSSAFTVEYQREPESTEGIPNDTVSPMRDGIGVKLWQCWGWVPPDQRPARSDGQPDRAAWRLTVIANGEYVLRDDPSPTPDGKPPYFPIKAISIPGRLYGESVLKYIGPLADQQSRLANMRIDEVYLGIWQQFLIKKGALASDNQMLIQPGGAIEVNGDPGRPIGDAFAVLARQPLLPDVYAEDQYRQTQAEHAAAASDIMQGVSASDRQTATEVERRLQQGNARHMLQTLWNDYTVKKELLERTWMWLQMRLTKPRMIKMAGEEYANVDLTQIQVPINIVVSGGLFALSKETRLQMDQELVALAAAPAFSMWMKPGPILRRLLQDRGWKNPDAYIKTDNEVMVEQMLSALTMAGAGPQQNQQAMANAKNGEGGEGDSGSPNGAGGSTSMHDMPMPGEEASMAGGQAQQSKPPTHGAN